MKHHHTGLEVDEDYIPGSEYIFASSYENSDRLLKEGDIVLIPQPTISPNDPLNWSKWRRYRQIAIIMFMRGVTTAIADDSYSIIQGLSKDYPNFNTASFSTASTLMFVGIGVWAILNAPSAYLYGVRISYIVGRLFGIIGNAMFARVSSEGMLMASQFFVGCATSVGESVAILSFAHLCFQHRVNDAIGLFVLSTSAGTFAGPLIDGYVAENLGWEWVGYMGTIFEVVTLLLVLFAMDETYFDRAHFAKKCDINYSVIEGVAVNGDLEDPNKEQKEKERKANEHTMAYDSGASLSDDVDVERQSTTHAPSVIQPTKTSATAPHGAFELIEPKQDIPDAPKTYWQRMAIITPAVNIQGWGFVQYAKRTVLLCRVFAFPPVLFSGLQWSTQIGFTGVYKSIENNRWSEAPWNYSSGPLALMMMPNLIGAAIGSLYSTWMADWFVHWMAHRNGGMQEAESRLWLMFPILFLYPLGLFLFGVGTKYEWSWGPVYFGLGLVGFGFGAAGEITIAYMADCYPGMILEGMVGLVCVYTLSSIIIASSTKYWLRIGNLNSIIVCGVVGFFVIALSLPMYWYGKRMRKMTRGMYFRFIALRDSLDRD